MKYARFSKELGACHCSSFEKQKRGVGGGGMAAGGRKEKDHMREWSHPQKSLKEGT